MRAWQTLVIAAAIAFLAAAVLDLARVVEGRPAPHWALGPPGSGMVLDQTTGRLWYLGPIPRKPEAPRQEPSPERQEFLPPQLPQTVFPPPFDTPIARERREAARRASVP